MSEINIDKYSHKENYLAPGEKFFETHFQFTTVYERYKDKITGVVADFGCNSGGATLPMARTEAITKIYGVDLNQSALNVLEQMKPAKIECVFSNLTDIQLETESCDSAYSFHTLEHIYPEDLSKVLDEFYRVLKPNGYILINVPYKNAYPDNQHVSFFDEFDLKQYFETAGFLVEESFEDVFQSLTLLAKKIQK